MSLIYSMLPFYLIGNLHCLGMCGPLVVMLGKQKNRVWYFIGRLTSFTTVATLAGFLGATLDLGNVQPAFSIGFGVLLFIAGLSQFFSFRLPRWHWLQKRKQGLDQRLTLLLLRDKPAATFLFGVATVLLPCGQTFVVFSACALSGSAWVGLVNGAAFALLTSPSLLLAMQAHTLLKAAKQYYRPLLGAVLIIGGAWMTYRGLASLEVAPAPCPMCESTGRK